MTSYQAFAVVRFEAGMTERPPLRLKLFGDRVMRIGQSSFLSLERPLHQDSREVRLYIHCLCSLPSVFLAIKRSKFIRTRPLVYGVRRGICLELNQLNERTAICLEILLLAMMIFATA